jgi:hypothetical protein
MVYILLFITSHSVNVFLSVKHLRESIAIDEADVNECAIDFNSALEGHFQMPTKYLYVYQNFFRRLIVNHAQLNKLTI